MRLSLIAAVADNGVIGRDNRLPWRIPRDLRRFKALTMGHHLIVGRRTYESIGRPLPGRAMLVLSRGRPSLPPEVDLVRSLEEALTVARAAGETEAFVAGGEEIYRLALPRAERLYLTRVHVTIAGDAVFPTLEPDAWAEREREHYPAGEHNPMPLTFLLLERRHVPVQSAL